MNVSQIVGKSFGAADAGFEWAASQLPKMTIRDGTLCSGRMPVTFGALDSAKGGEDYAIDFAGDGVAVRANSLLGYQYALLHLADMLAGRAARQSMMQEVRFRTRNYKHEIRLHECPRSILNYTDEMWENLARQLIRGHFNGLVLYPPGHFFEYVLDYSTYPQAASKPEQLRTRVRESLNRGLAIIHKYGLNTFMQHFLGHFTQQLADAYKIPTTGRLSSIEHPEVDRYCRWCYHEIFRQVPDLDGLYFNFESTPNAHEHLLKTAIPEMNALDKKPIVVFRLWNYSNYDGMRRMMDAYQGRIILSHKVIDSSDAYYLPVADSRALEWKKHLGPQIEFMYCAGPCHNCGTNLCDQLWGDYKFVQDLLADAQAKGADSISFHTVNEFFSPDLKAPKGLFTEHELNMARLNRMHVQAAMDYFVGQTRTPAERAAVLAKRNKVSHAAGKALLKAVEAASQPVLLTYQQFNYTSAHEGYVNYGRWSHIQDPFFYYPATELNDQASRLMWQVPRFGPWVDKTIDTKVTPDGFMQHIIDYVDPSRPKAARHPEKVADMMAASMKTAYRALGQYRKLAGRKSAQALEYYLDWNRHLAGFEEHQIRAAIWLYSMYFAKKKAPIIAALKKGLGELELAQAFTASNEAAAPQEDKNREPSNYTRPKPEAINSKTYKVMLRVLMLDRLDVSPEMTVAREVLDLIQRTEFPEAALAAFIESHRFYNETRRIMRPLKGHDERTVSVARGWLAKSLAAGQKSAKLLGKHPSLAENVAAWVNFVKNEIARATPPSLVCGRDANSNWVSLQHDDSFKGGDNFMEDFLGFFQKLDYLRPSGLMFRVSRTDDELVVTLREQGVDMAARMARWKLFADEGSCSHVERLCFDVEAKGQRETHFIVWPMGSSVSMGRKPHMPVKTQFASDAVSWQTVARVPFSLLGRTPAAGETWGFNITSNPAVARNVCYTWACQYDNGGNAKLFGKLTFE